MADGSSYGGTSPLRLRVPDRAHYRSLVRDDEDHPAPPDRAPNGDGEAIEEAEAFVSYKVAIQ